MSVESRVSVADKSLGKVRGGGIVRSFASVVISVTSECIRRQHATTADIDLGLSVLSLVRS